MKTRDKFDDNEMLVLARILVEEGPAALEVWLDELTYQPSDECIQAAIARIHPSHNLFEFLAAMREADVRPGLNMVLAATHQLDKYDVQDVIHLMRLANKIDPAFIFQIQDALDNILSKKPDLTIGILDEMKRSGIVEPISVLLWASAYGRTHMQEALEILHTASCENGLEILINVALFIHLPHAAKQSNESYTNIVDKVVPSILKLIKKEPNLAAAWQAVWQASEFSVDAAMTLQMVPNSNNRAAQNSLLCWVAEQGRPELTVNRIPVSELLLPISQIAQSDPVINQIFDACLSRLLRRTDTSGEALKVLASLSAERGDLTVSLRLTMHALSSNQLLFTKLFSEWLMSEKVNSQILRSLIRGCVSNEYPSKIDGSAFIAAGIPEKKRIAMRLLAWAHNAPCLVKFAEDLAEDPEKQPDGVAVAHVIIGHLVSEYPASSADWLASKVVATNKDTAYGMLYRHHHTRAIPFRDALEQLPVLAELAPTSQHQLAMRQREIRNQRQIGQVARAKSVFSQMATKVNIMQGKRVATLLPDGSMKISDMTEFSYSIELPMSERADPVGGLIKRIDYLANAQ